MEFIKRKVFLTRDLKPVDTNGDGVFNALSLLATTKIIQIPLIHSFDDMGVYEVSNDEHFEIIDIGGIFDGSITGVTQPPVGPGPITGNTWNGGGSSDSPPSNDGQVEYCGDLSAINGASVTFSGSTAILTPNNSSPVLYTSPTPTFIINYSLCTYEQPIGVDNTATSTVSGMEKLFNWGTYSTDACGSQWTTISTWNSFQSTAYNAATSRCQTLFGPSATVLTNNDFINPSTGNAIAQGDCSNPPTVDANGNLSGLAFAGVKLQQSWGPYYCCTSNCGENNETGVYKYRYYYCFYCKS